MSEQDVSLFDAPDLAALQRNWPRIVLRGAILLFVPFCVTMLARSLALYPTIARLPLPLDFLDVGPLAYEAKVVFAIVAALLALAFLMPKRTGAFVIAICVGGVLWTGHVYITLQWARLFATKFAFRADAAPAPAAWIYASLLMSAGVVFLLLENLLDTRQQQEARNLGKEDTRALFDVAWRTLGMMTAIGAGLSIVLLLAYAGLRALLTGAQLPFRLNPVFVLLVMGICLAVLVAIAARKRTPVAHVAWMDAPPLATVAAGPIATAAPATTAPVDPAPRNFWKRMERWERVAFVASLVAILTLFLPFRATAAPFGVYDGRIGLASFQGAAVLAAAAASMAAYVRARPGKLRRLTPLVAWGLALATFAPLFTLALKPRIVGQDVVEIGAFLSLLVALGTLSAALLAARTPTPP